MKGIDLNRVSDFLKIVEMGNITRAAIALGEPKAKLSRSLALLEKELGVQLVYRTTRQFQLTQSGLNFYRETKIQIEGLAASIDSVKAQDEVIEGPIRITAPEDFGNNVVTPLVSEFSKLHPKVQVRLVYSNEVLDLVKLGIDVAFRIGNLKDSSLIVKKLGRIEFVVVATASYLEKSAALSEPADLLNHQTIGISVVEENIWKLESAGGTTRIRLKPSLIANTFTSVISLALHGAGVAFVPRFLAEESLQSGKLVRVLSSWGSAGMPVQLTMPQQKKVPARVRSFFDFSARRVARYF